MVKNLPSNAGVTGSIPDQGTKIPHAMGQLSLRTATREKPTSCKEEPMCAIVRNPAYHKEELMCCN